MRDLLRNTVFEDAEIRRMKAADVVTFFIGDDNGDENFLDVETDNGILGEQGAGRENDGAFRQLQDD